MPTMKGLTTTVSADGSIVLPSAIREQKQWATGTCLLVEDTPEGVLLKPARVFAETRPEDVFGSLPHKGRPKTLEEMEAGVLAAARTALKP
ncbi:AbrB/MazE/SpoVT family DNA-binding domain-containing protein [Mesorhizobium sp. M0306]|uniref:AbrB/MazE/SpoVT family DNA-binding domain-containing protein n=2 Tax=unclassified Mesorhizobium TaxID=325217 RepID=UPI00333D4760